MHQNILSGTAAALFLTTIALPLPGYSESVDEVPQIGSASSLARTLGSPSDGSHADGSHLSQSSSRLSPSSSASSPNPLAQGDVVKLGEQSPTLNKPSPSPALQGSSTVIAKVHAHALSGRKAATLYVRGIPVLTFIGPAVSEARTPSLEPVKLGQQSGSLPLKNVLISTKSLSSTGSPGVTFFEELKLSPQHLSSQHNAPSQNAFGQNTLGSASADLDQHDPTWRASAIAAKLNDLNRQGIDGNQITVGLDGATAGALGDRYIIKVGDTTLALIDADTRLPDSTQDWQQDALQATNRLRRLLGNAAPLATIADPGSALFSPAYGATERSIKGWASWYGPGFNGNMSASGEIFNQADLTAAHRTLPFGTRVRVTNMDNGTSVVVRINDRGPYAGDRVLDLSMGAARVLGLIQSGVAPVRLDILTRQTATRGE